MRTTGLIRVVIYLFHFTDFLLLGYDTT